MFRAIGKTAVWAVLGAAVGAAASGLYGVLFGTLAGLLYGDTARLALASLCYFAFRGAIAGAVAGGFAWMIDPEGVADLTNFSPRYSQQRRLVFLRAGGVGDPRTLKQPRRDDMFPADTRRAPKRDDSRGGVAANDS
jgi:hypothetical protein